MSVLTEDWCSGGLHGGKEGPKRALKSIGRLRDRMCLGKLCKRGQVVPWSGGSQLSYCLEEVQEYPVILVRNSVIVC